MGQLHRSRAPAPAARIRRAPLEYGAWHCFRPCSPFPGAFPRGFPKRVLGKLFPDGRSTRWISVCCGIYRFKGAVHLDRDAGVVPNVVGDSGRLPFRDGVFSAALADPPYTREFAMSLYGMRKRQHVTIPRLLAEMVRVTAAGRRVGLLHQIQPTSIPRGTRLVGYVAILLGPGRRPRVFSYYEITGQLEIEFRGSRPGDRRASFRK